MGRCIQVICIGALLALVGCSGGSGDRDRRIATNTLMVDELDVAADGIWEHSGYVITEAEGEVSLFPSTDEGWAKVAKATRDIEAIAYRLAEAPYAVDDHDWPEIALGLVDAATAARTAVEARDEDALFNAGGQLYRVCLACHERYMTDPEGSVRAPS